MAFIPGTTLRGPLYKGLPTIEQHRHMTLLQSSHSLLKYNLIIFLLVILQSTMQKQLHYSR